jgi:hypothetical protein
MATPVETQRKISEVSYLPLDEWTDGATPGMVEHASSLLEWRCSDVEVFSEEGQS